MSKAEHSGEGTCRRYTDTQVGLRSKRAQNLRRTISEQMSNIYLIKQLNMYWKSLIWSVIATFNLREAIVTNFRDNDYTWAALSHWLSPLYFISVNC